MDNVAVRTAQDLEKKYNLSKLAGQVTNIETNSNDIIHIQKEINDILKTFIINLGDTLQTSVSLWFYEGTPTLSKEPYTDWITPADHYDDYYYDQLTGYVYKFTSNGWELQNDINLATALAITNAELDVSLDHERKVYLTQPTPPYSSGDWWILEDGTLKICQLGKLSGDFEETDFIVSTMYTTTIASKENNTITVLKGTVTQITEDYVKFTDLSTGGSSTIAGDNITTGSIKSANYVQGVSGTKIHLSDGKIETPNFMLYSNGAVHLTSLDMDTDNGSVAQIQFGQNGDEVWGFIDPIARYGENFYDTDESYVLSEYISRDGYTGKGEAHIRMVKKVYNNDHTSSTDNEVIHIAAYDDDGFIRIGGVTIPHYYSTNDEQKIGKWINGETLYRKVVDLGTMPNATTKNVAHNISNLGTAVSLRGFATNGSSTFPLPFSLASAPGGVDNNAYNFHIYINSTNIVVGTGVDRSSYSGYAIVDYTKSS